MKVVKFDNGSQVVEAILVKDNGDGTAVLFAPEGDGNDVKRFESVPKGEGGITYSE